MLPPPRAGWLHQIGVVVAVLGLTIVGVDYLSVPPAATGRIAITTAVHGLGTSLGTTRSAGGSVGYHSGSVDSNQPWPGHGDGGGGDGGGGGAAGSTDAVSRLYAGASIQSNGVVGGGRWRVLHFPAHFPSF